MTPRLGITYVPYLPPEQLRDLASASAALAWTDTVRVGIGLMPVPLRNVALVTAMGIATLCRLFHGRLLPGIGHGVQPWMAQVGERVSSPLTLLREYATALRRLLAGERITVDGRYVRLDRVQLDWPPADPPPLALGGEGPRSVALAGELADVYLLSAARTDAEIAAAHAILTEAGRLKDARAEPPPMVVSPITATGPGACDGVAAEIPFWGKEPVPGIGAAGDAEAVAANFRRLAGLGATTFAVQPTRDEPDLIGLIAFLGREVKPLLAA